MIEFSNQNTLVIAVIDSGIDPNFYSLSENIIMSTGFYLNDFGIIKEKVIPVQNYHGTIITSIIKYFCTNVKFININILDKDLLSDGRILIHSLKKAIEFKPDIIHMSLGTTKLRYKYPLKLLIKKAKCNNIIVVSAADNNGNISYPAYIKGVLAVKSKDIKDFSKYYFHDGFFLACNNAKDILNSIDSELTFKKDLVGTSISAAYITAFVSKLLCADNNINSSNIQYHLEKFMTKS